MQLIEDAAAKWWKLWSVRIHALEVALMGWLNIDPTPLLALWNMLPGPIAQELPSGLVLAISVAIFGLTSLARLIHQPALAKEPANV